MDSLSATQLKNIQALLLELQAELLEQLSISEEASAVVTLDQTAVGRVSRVDAMQQQSMAVSTRSKANLKLRRVRAAIAAIAREEYGYCASCDEDIGVRRLLAQPEATLCFGCQDKADRQQ